MIVVVNDNHSLNQEINPYTVAYGGRLAGRHHELWHFSDIDLARVAESLGVKGIRVEKAADFGPPWSRRSRPTARSHRCRHRYRRSRSEGQRRAGRCLTTHFNRKDADDGQEAECRTVRELSAKYSNWGRWGTDDQLGTLNHMPANSDRRRGVHPVG